MLLRCVLSCTFFALFLSGFAFSQEFRATVTGRVTDATGTGVPNAKVTVQNTATNEQSVANTTGNGDFTVPFLIPGKYNLTVEAPGFKQETRNNIELRVNDKVTLNFAMQIGAVTESVEVIAAPPLLETASASRGGVIDNLRVTELPLNGRNPINFVNLNPGVVFAGNPQFTRPFDNGDNINFSINGGLRQTNEYLLDGSPDDAVTDTAGDRTHANLNIAYIPTVDAVQEFRVMTNFYDAQYGRTGGGVINITTKSGANAFHGTGYEFLRRYQLDANNTGANAAGRPRYAVDPATGKNLGGHKLDQYGTELTGPVWIPKVYNGKDKTFFAFGFENYIESAPIPTLTSVPSLAERNGDFSKAGFNIYNPFSTQLNPAFDPTKGDSASNPQFIRSQFQNNMIPAGMFNAVGLAIIRSFPAPNFGSPDAVVNNYLASPNLSEDHFRNWIARVDQAFGQKERMFFRYSHNRRDQFDNTSNGFPIPGMDAQDPLIRLNDNAVIDSVTVLTPSTILNLRVGYTRFIQAAFRTGVTGYDITKLGFPASFAAQRFNNQPPAIEFDSQYPRWGARNPSQNTTNVLSFQPSVSFIRGRHSMKAGAEVRDIRPNARGGSFLWGAGEFRFTTDYTRRLPAFSDGSGDRIAALLLGTPTTGILQYVPILAYRWGYYGAYFQDDFRVSDRLTVNLGLRYDIEGTPTERYNRMNRGFGFNQPNPLGSNPQVKNASAANCPVCANLTGGLLFVNTGGQSQAAFNQDLNNWQPRIGAAYRVSERTVARGGYGIFYLPEATYGGSAGFASDTPFLSNTGGGINQFIPTGSLSNPFPNGAIAPTGSSAGLATFGGRDIIFQNPDRKIPYVHSFSFGIQHQLPWNLVIDTSYVGSRTIGVNTNDNQSGGPRNLNVLSVQQLAQAHLNPSFYNQAVANPFAGLLPGTNLNSSTLSRAQLLLPYPEFGQVQIGLEPVGKIWYDSLQVNVEKRFSKGLVFQGAYTWSKNLEAVAFLNPQDPAPTRDLTSSDRTHRFVFSGVYQLPIGRGRQFAGGAGKALNQVIGGWEYNWIGTLQSGTPRDLPGNYDLIGNLHVADQTNNQWFNNCELLANGTTRQPNAAQTGFVTGCSNPAWLQRSDTTYTLRNTPFRSNLRSPWSPQWDMALNKKFIIREGINAEFRFESFNTFNTVIHNEPNNDPNSAQFGVVTLGQRNFPRQVQLGFKFNF
ncbi:MAG: carboxypeptidase regulatory-like domain-containing protein [Bryobacteraceae bacterium]